MLTALGEEEEDRFRLLGYTMHSNRFQQRGYKDLKVMQRKSDKGWRRSWGFIRAKRITI